MTLLYEVSNFGVSNITDSSFTAVTTSFTLANPSNFDAPAVGQYIPCVLWNYTDFPGAPFADTLREIIYISDITGSIATLLRAQEGTSAIVSKPGKTYRIACVETKDSHEASVLKDTDGNYQCDSSLKIAGPSPWYDVTHDSYGAAGDGVTDDTAAVQAAIDAAISNGGGVVLFPPGTYLCGALEIASGTNIEFIGPGAMIQWTGTASGGGYIGFELSGACFNVTLRDLTMVGDGNTSNGHAGVWSFSGLTATLVRVIGCRITDAVVGCSLAGTMKDIWYLSNHVEDIVGTTAGQGYGLHVSEASYGEVDARILHNTIINCGRHGVYHAAGGGSVIAFNTFRDHRSEVATGGILPACVVSRSYHVSVHSNDFTDCYDGCVTADGDTNYQSDHVAIEWNHFYSPGNDVPAIVIGTTAPATVGFPTYVTVRGNEWQGTDTNVFYRGYCGQHILVERNRTTLTASTGTRAHYQIYAADESSGTSDYSDDLTFRDNLLIGAKSSGTHYGFNLASSLCTAGVELLFRENDFQIPDDAFLEDATTTDANLFIEEQDSTGITVAIQTIASATSITLPKRCKVFFISGTTDIDTINGGWAGRRVTLIFADALTVSDGGGNCKLSAALNTAADTVLELVFDGSNWQERSRSAN